MSSSVVGEVDEISDPAEWIEDAACRIEAGVGGELLSRLWESRPGFFEQAIVGLLLKVGYGGAARWGQHIYGGSNHGADGLIDQDVVIF